MLGDGALPPTASYVALTKKSVANCYMSNIRTAIIVSMLIREKIFIWSRMRSTIKIACTAVIFTIIRIVLTVIILKIVHFVSLASIVAIVTAQIFCKIAITAPIARVLIT